MFTSYKRMRHLKTIVGPASKLHLAVLVVKREPCDVNEAGGLKKVMSQDFLKVLEGIEEKKVTKDLFKV